MAADYRPPPAWARAAGAVANVAALALLAWVLAYWGWRWFAPESRRHEPPAGVGAYAPAIADAHLFGRAETGASSPAAAARSTAPVADVRVLGVLAGPDGSGEALVRVGGKPAVLVRSGRTIEPGIDLVAVEPNAIVVEDAGGRRRIELRPGAPVGAGDSRPVPGAIPPRAAPAASAAPATTATRAAPAANAAPSAPRAASTTPAPRVASCVPPEAADAELYLLRSELLAGMIRDPASWRGLLRSEAGALSIADGSGFAALLGLRVGDRIERANGVALLSYEDVAANVLRPLTQSERVTVTGMRDGRGRRWVYVNAASCPSG